MNAIEYCIARTHAQLVKKLEEEPGNFTAKDIRLIQIVNQAVIDYREREEQLAPPKN